MTLTFQDFPTFSTSIIYVNKSTDGGLTWGPPTQLIRDDSLLQFNDKNSMTRRSVRLELRVRDLGPQPLPERQAGGALDLGLPALASERRDLLPHDERRGELGAGTGDLRTEGEPVRDRPPDRRRPLRTAPGTAGRRVHALPRLWREQEGPGDRGHRLRDRGVTWSDPITVSKALPGFVSDPDDGTPLRTGDIIPDIGAGPTASRTSSGRRRRWQRPARRLRSRSRSMAARPGRRRFGSTRGPTCRRSRRRSRCSPTARSA